MRKKGKSEKRARPLMKTKEGRNKREVSVRGGLRGTEGESEMKMPE
jgi:hypothetical protein